MIGYLLGKILKKESDRLILLANQVGYEVLVPAMVMESLAEKKTAMSWRCTFTTSKPSVSPNRY